MLCLSFFALGGTVPTALAQFHGQSFHGDNASQTAPSIATRPSAAPCIVANTSNGLYPTIVRPFSMSEATSTGGSLQQHYDFGGGNLRLLAAANSSSNTNVGAAGTCLAIPGKGEDAFFLDISSNIEDNLQQMVVFSEAGNGVPSDIIELQDNSFVMVGNNTIGNVSTSWVARISARPNYVPLFFRTIGDPLGSASQGEGAVAVLQANSGIIMVAGNTLQLSSSSQGSIYIAELNLSGVVKSFHTYTIEGNVQQPRVTDMVQMPDGSFTLVGTTKIPSDPDKYGFIMQVPADLNSATFQEVRQPGNTTSGQLLNAIALEPGSSTHYIAGTVLLPVAGSIKRHGLVIKVVPPFGPQLAQAFDVNDGNEAFTDIVVLDNGNTVEAVGTADRLPANVSGPAGSNIWTVRMNTDLISCTQQGVALQFDPKPVTHAAFTPVNSSSNPALHATMTINTTSIQSLIPCQSAARMAGGTTHHTGLEGASVQTDPSKGKATVRIEDDHEPTQVSLTDASGQTVRQWTMAGTELTLDLTELPAGIYTVGLLQGPHFTTHKLNIP